MAKKIKMINKKNEKNVDDDISKLPFNSPTRIILEQQRKWAKETNERYDKKLKTVEYMNGRKMDYGDDYDPNRRF